MTEAARENMVTQQIRCWDVFDQRVLDLLGSLPREAFVPEQYQGLAYADTEIPLGRGESMLAPKLEARMLQALALQAGETVLEIGTGSGFLTACLARLGGKVTSLDIHAEFTAGAKSRLAELGIRGVELDTRDALETSAVSGAFDAIAVTGSLPHRAPELEQHLNVGGRMFVVLGQAPIMEATLITRVGEHEFLTETLFETSVPPLRNCPQTEKFRF